MPHRDVASHRPGADEGGALPCAGNGFIISKRRFALNADSGRAGVRAQPQIDAPADPVRRDLGQNPDEGAGHLDIEGLACCRFGQRVVERIMQQDQIDV